jgi:hypothetical protein
MSPNVGVRRENTVRKVRFVIASLFALASAGLPIGVLAHGLNNGFPKTAGIKSSRNNNSFARAPTERPAAPLSGMIASAAKSPRYTKGHERP